MLDLVWHGYFNDGRVINQYEHDGKENRFQEVLDNQDKLTSFVLRHVQYNIIYVVDLVNGCIFLGQYLGDEQPFNTIEARADMLRKEQYQYRLIYFREVERTFNSNLQEAQKERIIYFVGFQYTDENRKNHKRIMKISSDGRLTVN